MSEVLPGKKVKMEIYANDAPTLREKGQDFQQAIIGKTIKPDDQLMFNDVIIGVTATKPKGPIKVSKGTAIKMGISKRPMMLTCPNCGRALNRYSPNCPDCDTAIQVLAI